MTTLDSREAPPMGTDGAPESGASASANAIGVTAVAIGTAKSAAIRATIGSTVVRELEAANEHSAKMARIIASRLPSLPRTEGIRLHAAGVAG